MPSWPHTDSATASRSYALFCFAWSSYGGTNVDGIGRGWEDRKMMRLRDTLPFAESFGSATMLTNKHEENEKLPQDAFEKIIFSLLSH